MARLSLALMMKFNELPQIVRASDDFHRLYGTAKVSQYTTATILFRIEIIALRLRTRTVFQNTCYVLLIIIKYSETNGSCIGSLYIDYTLVGFVFYLNGRIENCNKVHTEWVHCAV